MPPGTPDIRALDPSTPCARHRTEAQKSPYREHYFAAERVEVKTLAGLLAWILESRASVPEGHRVLLARWVYAWKKFPDGRISHVKARYTVQGQHQVEGVDYMESYAATMTLKGFRSILAIANLDPNVTVDHFDVSAAYINASQSSTPWFTVSSPLDTLILRDLRPSAVS